ncbi:hypothetical protein FDECE_1562 [Fusarium decemcellulare]|nr:hypothetical protein FDECE_1562 [Fusarium decemcellulare]
MKMHGIFGLVLASIALGHVVPYGLDSDSTSLLLERQAPQQRVKSIQVAPFDAGEPDGFASGKCTREQIKKLGAAIKDARVTLKIPGNALAEGNAETTRAYKDWFGVHTDPSGERKELLRKSIRTHNFDAPHHALGLTLKEIKKTLTLNTLDPYGLTFTCWGRNDEHCTSGMVAGTIPPGRHQGLNKDSRGTLIGLCPSFFESPSLEEAIAKFEQNDPSLLNTAALTLIHEMQHVPLITGKERNCIDVPDHRGRPAYDAQV